ncbi:MAG: DNA polymerase I [Prolixibacteraceae bacterium]|jgi:DNA polymerase-1|nr:DNA polymerase I [Prolixibacteraceae bacterium]
MKKLFLIDAYALIYRSYFAFINNPRVNSKGMNTSAVFGFVNTLEQILRLEQPTHLAVAFDLHGPTFRHELFDGYKATREAMPEAIRTAIPYIRRMIDAYNIPTLECIGYEADDVIGTMAKTAEKEDFKVFMVTPDKDYAQLVSANIFMYKPKRMGNEMEVWGVEQVCDNFQISRPEQVIDLLGLMGDSSDNIPGCPGIGPKGAAQLISQFGGIDGVYAAIGQLKGKQQESLINFEEQVRLSRKLAEIIVDVPLNHQPEELVRQEPDQQLLNELFSELEFRNMLSKLPKAEVVVQKPVNPQGSLFDFAEESVAAPVSNLEQIHSYSHNYHLVEGEEARANLINELLKQKEFCFDTETTGLDPLTDHLVGISISFKKGEAYYIPVPSNQKEAGQIVASFKPLFDSETITKVGQNIKFDALVLSGYGIKLHGPIFDTMVAHYLIQPELRHNLDFLSEIYLGYKKIATSELIGSGKNQTSMFSVDLQTIKEYACEDADFTFQLKPLLEKEMIDGNVAKLFKDVEMPLLKVLIEMELSGMKIDVQALDQYAVILREQIIQLELEITEMAGELFNISSPKQLGHILFDKLLLDPKAKKTKTKQYSTNEEVLTTLLDRHPIVAKILDHRGLKKLLSTYVESLPKLINPKTGRIHTSYNQTVAVTGRLSSNNPNLQNIPIRDENGREIRKAFVPRDSDHLFLSADYSQIELRIMAALSGDKVMIEAFANGEDIHAATAAKIYNIPLGEVTSDMRRKAKTANFGIIYGISPFGLAQRLNIPRNEAKQLIDDYFINFPRVKQYMDEQIQQARKRGYVETIMGRRRYLKDITSENAAVRGFAERNAINAPIQGSAADIIKVAMVRIQKRFDEEKISSKMMLQVHDELNFDLLKSETDIVKKIVKEEMEHAVEMVVPLEVEMDAAENWLLAH